jgi:formimidoylglutamate deiminase
MYRYLDHLTPDDIEAITAFAQMGMLEAGYAGVAEFHYVHHQPDGSPYDEIAELSARIAAATETSGIGLTLLPVLYQYGGCDARALAGGQRRFGNDPDRFAALFADTEALISRLTADAQIGVAAHSLRAVSEEGLAFAADLAKGRPLHLHVAEQAAEIDEVLAARGKRPVEWLLDNHAVDERWCLIHCTNMLPHETEALARSGAIAGLCPITESSLGDGIFDGVRFAESGGRFGMGTDSNIRISLAEELRTLEYSQRLRDRGRARLAGDDRSTGRFLFEAALAGGAQAAGRDSGAIAPGKLADLIALDPDAPDLLGKEGDTILDSFIFAGDNRMIRDVWSAGRHVVHDGRHRDHDAIARRYRKTILSLKDRL